MLTDQQIDEFLEMLAKSPTSARDMVRGLFAKAAPAVPDADELESALERLVERCNTDQFLCNDDAVIHAEATLKRIYKSRKSTATPAAPSQPAATCPEACKSPEKCCNFGCQREPSQPVALTDMVPRAALQEVERERDYYKVRTQTMHEYLKGEVWYWQGDGQDHPESWVNSLPVVIRADQLRELMAQSAVPGGEPVAQVEVSVPHLRSIVVRVVPGADVPPVGTSLYTAAPSQEQWETTPKDSEQWETSPKDREQWETTPKAAQEPVTLTDEELMAIGMRLAKTLPNPMIDLDYARAIIAALREKGGA